MRTFLRILSRDFLQKGAVQKVQYCQSEYYDLVKLFLIKLDSQIYNCLYKQHQN
jgi:hypothetical protein